MVQFCLKEEQMVKSKYLKGHSKLLFPSIVSIYFSACSLPNGITSTMSAHNLRITSEGLRRPKFDFAGFNVPSSTVCVFLSFSCARWNIEVYLCF